MARCSRFARLAVCFVLCAAVFAQDRRDQDEDRGYDHDDHREQRDCGRLCDHGYPRTSAIDYLFLPGFPGARQFLPIAINSVANAVTATPFHLDRYFRVGHISLSIIVPSAGSHAYVGIYNAHGNLLVQGKFSTDAVGDMTIDVSPRVLLKPGMYYFAIGAEDTVSQSAGYLFDDPNLNFIHGGSASNPIVDGCLPATLGTVSHPQPGSMPSAVFTP